MRHHHRELSEKEIQSHIFFRSFYLTIWGKAAFNVVKGIQRVVLLCIVRTAQW